jgi:hypothetical protein
MTDNMLPVQGLSLQQVLDSSEVPALSVSEGANGALLLSLRLKETATLGGITVVDGLTTITINSAV